MISSEAARRNPQMEPIVEYRYCMTQLEIQNVITCYLLPVTPYACDRDRQTSIIYQFL